jgi:C-terminal processing protease CtpA/Prc
MNTLRKLSNSSKPKAPRHTVSISRSEGSLGLGLDDDNCVTSITPGSSAAATDVLVGDYVVGIGGKPVGSRKLVSVLAENAGSEIELEIERGSAESNGSSTPRGGSMPRFGSSLFGGMSRRSTQSGSDDANRAGSFAQAGETVVTLLLAREANEPWGLEVDETNSVSAVMSDSLAYRAGFIVDDEVTKVDGEDLGSRTILGDEALMGVFETALQVTLTVRRGVQMTRDVSFTPRRNSADI